MVRDRERWGERWGGIERENWSVYMLKRCGALRDSTDWKDRAESVKELMKDIEEVYSFARS